jgi:hypothetical protein
MAAQISRICMVAGLSEPACTAAQIGGYTRAGGNWR